MATKQTVLTQLGRGELQWIADRHGLAVGDRRKLDDLHEAIRRLPKATLRETLQQFERERLKEICRGLDLDDGGKLKSEIVSRLLGGHEDVEDGGDDGGNGSGVNHKLANTGSPILVGHLTRDELLLIADFYELAIDDRRRRESAIEAVSGLPRSKYGEALLRLSRDRLKDLCVELELDDTGKSKITLVERLLGESAGLEENDVGKDDPDDRDEDEHDDPEIDRSQGKVGKSVTQPRLFIGSSVEFLKVAKRVQLELDYDFDVTIWHQSLFEPGAETWYQLVRMARNDFDFALFVFGADDVLQSRKESTFSPRDNVLLEYGLFVGAIGPERTFFLYNRNHKPKIASDLAGITALTYRDRDNLQAALGPACTQLHDICERLGRRDQARR